MGSPGTIGEQGTSLSLTPCRFPRFCRTKELDPQQRRQPINIARVALDCLQGKVSTLAQADGAYFDGVVKTAWAVLLRCYTGQDKVSFSFSCTGDDGCSNIIRFIFDDGKTLSVADTVQAAAASAKAPGATIGCWTQVPGIPCGEAGKPDPGSVDTAILLSRSAKGRNGPLSLGRVPKLEVCCRPLFCFDASLMSHQGLRAKCVG